MTSCHCSGVDPKPQLHQSHLGLLYRCGEKFRRVVIEGDKEPPGVALVVGSATHEAVRADLTHKVETGGELLPDEAVKDAARDALTRRWDESPVMLAEDERADGLDVVKGRAIDQSVALSSAHHAHIAPGIMPEKKEDTGEIGLEWPWVIEAQGYPYDLAGCIDVIDVADGLAIRDTKTAKSLPGQSMVDTSEQLTLYAMAYRIIRGVMPDKVVIDALVKGKEARAVSYTSARTLDDFRVMRARFEQAIKIIEAGAFTPANMADWWCSPKFCGFYADGSCRYVNAGRPMTISLNKPTIKGGKTNVRRPVITAGSREWLDAIG